MRPAFAALLILCVASGPAMADSCSGNDRTAGTVIGGVLGGVLGGLLTQGKGVGIAGGALLGGLAGNVVASDLECQDQPYAARTYDRSFHGQVGHRYDWSRGPNRGYVMTSREYAQGPRLCRDFTQVVYRHGREYDRQGTACRRPNGEWEFL